MTVAGNGTYPSGPFTPTAPGTYRFVATYSGDANNAAVTTACNAAGESVVVSPASPAIVTTASAPTTVGNPISDSATLSGGVAPTGTITFTVFGPNNAGCTGAPAFTSMTTVSGNGTYSSAAFTTTAAGTYRFVAAYSGDANNNAVTSACNAAGESVVVSPASPAIVTTASAPTTVGNPISDSATLCRRRRPDRDDHLHRLRPEQRRVHGRAGLQLDDPGLRERDLLLGGVHHDRPRDLPLRGRLQRRRQQQRGDQRLQRRR